MTHTNDSYECRELQASTGETAELPHLLKHTVYCIQLCRLPLLYFGLKTEIEKEKFKYLKKQVILTAKGTVQKV